MKYFFKSLINQTPIFLQHRFNKKNKNFLQVFLLFSRWEGTGSDEVGKEKGTNIVRIKIDSKYYRPTEVV